MASSTLLLTNVRHFCTTDAAASYPATGAGITDGGVFARDGIIEKIGKSRELPGHADTMIDLSGYFVIPGRVNTHHHLFLNLTRVVPAVQNAPLLKWLQTLYPIWRHLSPDHVY